MWFTWLHTGLSVLYTLNVLRLNLQKFPQKIVFAYSSFCPRCPQNLKFHWWCKLQRRPQIAAPSALQFACASYCSRCTVSLLRLRSFPTLKHLYYCDNGSHIPTIMCHIFTLYKQMKPEFLKCKRNKYSARKLTFKSPPVTWRTNSLTFNNCTLCPHCIYVFCIYLKTNSDLCHLQHKLIGFYNRDEKCLLRGTNWEFK